MIVEFGGAEVDTGRQFGVVEGNRAVALNRPARPQEGYENNRVLQPLGLVDRDDFDQGLVIFEAKFGVLVTFFRELLQQPAGAG